MAGKAQTAIELLTVYGWVILLILVVLVIAYYSGYLDLGQVLPTQCTITPTMGCRSYRFGYTPDGQRMVLVYRVVNGLGYDIQFSNDAVTLYVENVGKFGKREYNGTCYPISYSIKPGTPLSCIVFIDDSEVVPSIGKNLEFKLSIRYRNCNALPDYPKTGNCTGAPEYTVTGVIRTQMEPPAPSLYACGDEVCDYVLGENPTNCCNDCPVERLTLTADPNPVEQYNTTTLIATALYNTGVAAEGATVFFDKVDFNESDWIEPASNITNASGVTISKYNSQAAGNMTLNASTCGPNATTVVRVEVLPAPANGTIGFSYYPSMVPAEGYYEVNVSVNDSNGVPVPAGIIVKLWADVDSKVIPNETVTDENGIAHVIFTSNITHVGRLTASAIGVWNSTNLYFALPAGALIIGSTGTGEIGSEDSVHIWACLYNIKGEPMSQPITLTTDFGYFVSDVGEEKLPGVGSFITKCPTILSRADNAMVGYDVFGYNGTADGGAHGMQQIADPIEFDAYAGKFVRVYMTDTVSSQKRAETIAQYIKLKYPNAGQPGGRRVYIFYNINYVPNCGCDWIAGTTNAHFYNNLTKYLDNNPPTGIIDVNPVTISDPYELRDIMLNEANTTILIAATGQLPVEVYDCEEDGGVPKKFFQRGGVQIHTGNWEFSRPLTGDKDHTECTNGPTYSGQDGSYFVFGWYPGTSWVGSAPIQSVRKNNTITVKTWLPSGCFDINTEHPRLFSGEVGVANVTASFYSISNSTLVEFVAKNCSWAIQNMTCGATKPEYCISGSLVPLCKECGCGEYEACDPNEPYECVEVPGDIKLYLTTFNGTGTQLPNDGYTKLQVIAQVLDRSGEPVEGYTVEWESNGVIIDHIDCTKTSYDCGDYSAQPSPSDPRAAVYVISNGSWTGVANVTAKVRIGGFVINKSIDINVTTDKSILRTRWRKAEPDLLPADNYTNATLCIASFNKNDSAVGNISACFNTSLGTFDNGKSLQCYSEDERLHTDEFGQVCAHLKSDKWGKANVSALVENFTGTEFVNVTYYLYKNITFYQVPSSIEIKAAPNPAPPCLSTSYSKCSTSLMRINATFRNSTGDVIAGIPYVYFEIPMAEDPDYPLVWFMHGHADRWWWGNWGKLKPSYIPVADECYDVGETNNTCSASTNNQGIAFANFTPVYPAGMYNLTVSTYYRCNATPYAPANCQRNVSNKTNITVAPLPARIIINSTGPIKPDYFDNRTINITIYGTDGNPLEGVFCRAYIETCDVGKCNVTFYDKASGCSGTYTLDGNSGCIYGWYTNSSGRWAVQRVRANVSGNYTLTFETYYYDNDHWVTVSNSTLIEFSPILKTIIVNASPNVTYADGKSVANITITVMDSNGGVMKNHPIHINPPTNEAMLGCCSYTGCSCHSSTDANGQYKTTLYSYTIGDSNVSAYSEYSNGTHLVKITNYTNVTFKPPPSKATMSATPAIINGDGIDRSRVVVAFKDVSNNPTPGLLINCSVSPNSAFFPTANLITNESGEIETYISSIENPATIACSYLHYATGQKDLQVSSVGQDNVYKIEVKSNATSKPYGGYINVTANVTRISTGQSIADGSQVTFTTSYGGSFKNCGCNQTTATTMNGIAWVEVTASGPGRIFVKANVSGDWGVTSPPLEYT
ncbi:MAG: hypothetical protein QXF56_05835 [Candidatus Micrarchaeia archaeon]